MICCATLLLTIKLAWSAIHQAPRHKLASGAACHRAAEAPIIGRVALVEIGLATVLLALFSSAILAMAFGQSPGALFENIHQIGCLALGRDLAG